ncbi:G domain-containing protein [Aphelenchoides besseyi]|nr:G domain-containing protein [Aphelenchoides besseyi]
MFINLSRCSYEPVVCFRSLCTGPAVVEHTPIESRSQFRLPKTAEQTKWYPKHMAIQFARMEHRLRSMDLIIEVHDARIALTGRNPEFQSRLYAVRPHILVFNKMDLINKKKYIASVEKHYKNLGVKHVLWTDCKHRKSRALSELQTMMMDCLQSEYRFNRSVKTEYMIMITGIPNVGKSSLINSIRTKNLGKTVNAVSVGARPGVTIRLQNRVKIFDKPPVYILDTPGVLDPYTRQVEDTMKLGLCETILETMIRQEHLADYLLYWLNKHQDYSYLRALKLNCQPTDDIQQLLLKICQERNIRVRTLVPGRGYEDRWDFNAATEIFVGTFTNNKLDDCFLDRDRLVD